MFTSNYQIKGDKKLKLAIFCFLAFSIITLPMFVFSSRKSELYVDIKAGDEQDGSSSHPYDSISEAIDHAKDKAEIHVAKGEYKENISLEDGIKLFGEDKEKTIINAEKEKQAAVSMKNNSTINGFTIKDGKRGIWVEKDAKVSIVDCIIKDNHDDGIGIEGGDTSSSDQVSISETQIKDNDWTGIYSTGPRRIFITESEISGNKKDGIDLARGTKGWIGENSIRENGGSGMKLVLDGSEIWTRRNDIRENKREGIETASFGIAGRIDIAKTKIVKNGLFGIARLQRAGHADWNKTFTVSDQSELWENRSGNISNVIYIK
ncbi:MAG: hypothetical protein A2271_03990 [Candidatus Moranbacteria bacterium RIFOXYA12_FULL_35_19]|nr:MAG: Nitrous oxidase accessory protein NosD [Candidatus Moranbacteria bacterium GW2011_GWF2_35_39]OGI30170.1 MAG: hypothetical protein A2343_04240 [Candidatus Moranbacteria bacterium RIFOXYB12_FULL_35_8]OGI33301.1 MAG: hypothetical protein A2489_01195 [Candidatus Moranbacteria bacterium RIFOXYC12_FULL_36_13]OGI36819.1 MAG: hypothetical protein A2271_03990 [Candidatus Moranbacteria bacterium RIFOXYA12_FULL_35_19]